MNISSKHLTLGNRLHTRENGIQFPGHRSYNSYHTQHGGVRGEHGPIEVYAYLWCDLSLAGVEPCSTLGRVKCAAAPDPHYRVRPYPLGHIPRLVYPIGGGVSATGCECSAIYPCLVSRETHHGDDNFSRHSSCCNRQQRYQVLL